MSLVRDHTTGLLILAGGRATRLQPALGGLPKALIQFPPWRPPALDLAMRASRESMEVCLAVDQRSRAHVESYMAEHGQKAEYSTDAGTGTASAITAALHGMVSPRVLVCCADTIVPLDILEIAVRLKPRLPVFQILTPFSTQNAGLIGVSEDRALTRVSHWGEHSATPPPASLRAASSSGSYVIDRKYWISCVERHVSGLESVVMPEFVAAGAVQGHVAGTVLPTFDYGTAERLRYLKRNPQLLATLFRAFGTDVPPGAGHCLAGVDITNWLCARPGSPGPVLTHRAWSRL